MSWVTWLLVRLTVRRVFLRSVRFLFLAAVWVPVPLRVLLGYCEGGPGCFDLGYCCVGAASALRESLLGQLYKERGRIPILVVRRTMKRGLNAPWMGYISWRSLCHLWRVRVCGRFQTTLW